MNDKLRKMIIMIRVLLAAVILMTLLKSCVDTSSSSDDLVKVGGKEVRVEQKVPTNPTTTALTTVTSTFSSVESVSVPEGDMVTALLLSLGVTSIVLHFGFPNHK